MSTPEVLVLPRGAADLDCHPVEGEDKKRLAGVIRMARKRRGLSVDELAERLHVASSTVYGWESADNAPSLLMLGPLCDALGVSADLFRVLPEEPPSPVEAYLVAEAAEGARQGAQRAAKRRTR